MFGHVDTRAWVWPEHFRSRSPSVGQQTIVVRALFELTGWTDQEYLAALQSKSLVVAPKRTALGVSFLPFDQQVDRVGICSFWYLGHNMCTINSNNLGCPGDDGRMVRV